MDKLFKLIVAGGRDFDNYKLLSEYLIKVLKNKKNIQIVSGTAEGADSLGERFAIENNLGLKSFPAPWQDIERKPEKAIGTRSNGNKYWKGAGAFRNKKMAKYADALVVFWDGKSKGTSNMFDMFIAQGTNKPIRLKSYSV